MALPTPLTPSQVGGAADVAGLPVHFRTGPHIGKTLLVSRTDPNLQASIDDGSVLADPSVDRTPPGFSLISASPNTAAEETPSVTITLTGTGFLGLRNPYAQLVNQGGDSAGVAQDAASVTDTEFVYDQAIAAGMAGNGEIELYDDDSPDEPIAKLPFVITAAVPAP